MEEERSLNFIEQIVEKDLAEGKNDGRIQTRFPPEPNGYLHIGHVKAICMDFGIAERYNGVCNLRFDDTNPVKEDVEYVDSIQQDIAWLGFKWGNIYYASDYFQQLYDLAIRFIKEGKAYVDEQTAEQIAEQKGTPTEPGVASPYRDRPIEENLRLFEAMQAGEIEDGKMVLRAKIDMANPNMHFRDPIMYRIITTHPHHRTGRKWNVYPMYDFAHGQSDYFEGVTHSICTLEFVVHRPLYDYFLDQFVEGDYRPHQYEFNRLNITYTVMSKRKMLQLVKEGLVRGWDDPRMPTVCGLRRRGYTAEAIRTFIDKIGYTKVEGMIDVSLLEHTVRENLKETAPRVCAIFDPVKLVITNYEGNGETITAENIDGHPELGTREMNFARELYIERGDFLEQADKNFFRLSPGDRGVLRRRYTNCGSNRRISSKPQAARKMPRAISPPSMPPTTPTRNRVPKAATVRPNRLSTGWSAIRVSTPKHASMTVCLLARTRPQKRAISETCSTPTASKSRLSRSRARSAANSTRRLSRTALPKRTTTSCSNRAILWSIPTPPPTTLSSTAPHRSKIIGRNNSQLTGDT